MKNYYTYKAFMIISAFLVTCRLSAGAIEDRLSIVTDSGSDSANVAASPENSDIESGSTADTIMPAETKKVRAELPQPAAEDKVILESAINYFSNGDYNSAMLKTDELFNTYPSSLYLDQAKMIRARIMTKNGEYAKAVSELSSISKESGEYPASIFLRAEIYRKAKDNNNAREMYLKLASMFPGNDLADDSLLNLGDIYLAGGLSEKALETAVSIIRNYPDRETVDDAYFLLGKIFMQDKNLRDLQKARSVYKKFIYKAEIEKDPFFKNSPLLNRVKANYNDLNRYYFNEGN